MLGAVALLAIKSLLLFGIGLRPGRLGWQEALQLGMVLALGGEFAFVVLSEAVKASLIDAALQNRLVAIVGLSMALTPLSMIAASRLLRAFPDRCPRALDTIPDGHPQVIRRLRAFRPDRRAHAGGAEDSVRGAGTDPEQLDNRRRFGNVATTAISRGRSAALRAPPRAHLSSTPATRRGQPARDPRRSPTVSRAEGFARAHDSRHAGS